MEGEGEGEKKREKIFFLLLMFRLKLTTHLKESFPMVQSHNVCCFQTVLHLLPNANFLQYCGCPRVLSLELELCDEFFFF